MCEHSGTQFNCHDCGTLEIYGESYTSLVTRFGEKCCICGKTVEENGRRLSVDHDHVSLVVRGLLCNSCNLAVGWVEKTIRNRFSHDERCKYEKVVEHLMRGVLLLSSL